MDVVINLLSSILSSNPNNPVLDLEFSQLTSIGPLMPYLAQFRYLKQLSLHGNRLSDLPDDLSKLQSLEELDITNNLIQKVDFVIEGLRSIKNLRKLSINIKTKEEESLLIAEIPSLEILNNEKVSRNNLSGNFALPVTFEANPLSSQPGEQEFQGDSLFIEEKLAGIKQEDLESLSGLYDIIREVHRDANIDNDQLLADQFDEHVRNILGDLSAKLKDQNASETLTKSLTIKAKYALYEICFSKFMNFLGGIDQRLATILENLHDSHALIFKEMSMLSMSNNSAKEIPEKEKEKKTTNAGYEQHEIQQIVEAAEHFEAENHRLMEERNEFIEHINSIEQENQKLLELVIKHSKGDKNVLASSNINKYKELNSKNEKENSIKQAQVMMNPSNLTGLSEQSERPFASSIKAGLSKWAGIHSNIGHTNIRILTLKQLKDTIEEINESKQKYDKKCYEMKMPRETMEQHMYSFLNQKYGLKNLIIEWAMAIINGIKKFCFEDNDVTVFAKVLRNECDEEFKLVQNQVKNTIIELLRMHLRGKFPFKHNSEIKEMIDSKISGYIFSDESQDIIKYMYNKEDAELILEKLRESYIPNREKKAGREPLLASNEKDKLKISFISFQKTILDFQLKSHESFLGNFVALFKQIDRDNNGIIDENEFRELVSSMKIELDLDKMLYNVDPFNHQQITFSQLVTLFSSEMVVKEGKSFSILQALSLIDENA